jgi:hypothetical protein
MVMWMDRRCIGVGEDARNLGSPELRSYFDSYFHVASSKSSESVTHVVGPEPKRVFEQVLVDA